MSGRRLSKANRIARRLWNSYHAEMKDLRKPTDLIHVGCIGCFRKVRKPCSGPCCGDPRNWFGELTVQELKAPKVADFWLLRRTQARRLCHYNRKSQRGI
jgi:hypothetical protein